jgi:hypothetical protein
MPSSFKLTVSYSQIAVFVSNIENPFNDWTDQHIAQGFSWRKNSVSFDPLMDFGELKVTIELEIDLPVLDNCRRAISVPFSVPVENLIEVATISDSKTFELETGDYQLIFQVGQMNSAGWCKFSFILNGDKTPKILKYDEDFHPIFPLLMNADPAV